MSEQVKRYRVNTLPGRITRDCPEVVLASDFDALSARLVEAERDAKRYRLLFIEPAPEHLADLGIGLQRFHVEELYDKEWFDAAIDAAEGR